MSGNGKGNCKAGNKARQSGPKELYYVYFPHGKGLKLYRSKIDDLGKSRICDLTLHFTGVRGIHQANQAFVVSSHLVPPETLAIKDPQAKDFKRFNLKFHFRKDF